MSLYKLMDHNSQLITYLVVYFLLSWKLKGGVKKRMCLIMFATSEAILEASSELNIEVDGAVVRLISLEEGPGSSMKMRHYYLLTRLLVTKGREVQVWYSN